MHTLAKLLEDSADPSNTRFDILTAAEICAIVEALNCEIVIDRMRETYDVGNSVDK